jgi:hypothetical protein
MRTMSLFLAEGFCHVPMSHVVAPDPYPSGEWGPRAHVGLDLGPSYWGSECQTGTFGAL